MSVSLARTELNILDGKYAILRELGAGAVGAVYEAEHLVLGKRVAIKLLKAPALASEAARANALEQARAVARIAHANVTDIQDLGVTPDGAPYVVMELLEGQTIAEVVAANGARPLTEACEIALQILAGLAAAHRKDIVHGALTPANVIVTRPSSHQLLVKLVDFSLLPAGSTGKTDDPLRSPYRAPEQVLGQSIDERADVYACAAILYLLVTGQPHVRSKRGAQSALELRPVLEANPDTPPALAALIERGLQRDRSLRLGSAEEFAELLRGCAASLPPAPRVLSQLARGAAALSRQAPRTRRALDPSKPPDAKVAHVPLSPRIMTDSILMSPRLPKPPTAPKLEIGRDFMPMPGDPARDKDLELRSLRTRQPGSVPAWPALLAMLVGFSAGVLLAWAAGLL